MNTIYAGLSHRRTSETGVVPTIPSGDPLLNTDLFDGEMFINTTDKKAWVRCGSTFSEVAFKDALLHNTLPDLQGGKTDEYYHLDKTNYTHLTDRYSVSEQRGVDKSLLSFAIADEYVIDGVHMINNSSITLNFSLTDVNDKVLTRVELRAGESKYIVIVEQLTFNENALKIVSESVDAKNTYDVKVFLKKYTI